MQNSELDLLITHTMETLPDSLTRRKALLLSLISLAPTHPRIPAVRESLGYIDRHELAQRELVLSMKGN